MSDDPRTSVPGRPRARVVLLGGASGSGKTLLTRVLGMPRLELDDFYRDGATITAAAGDAPVDWDDPASWDAAAAIAAITELCHHGAADVPVYDIPSNRRTGTQRLDLGGARVFIAEGIFAAELAAPLRARGLLADAVCLRRNRSMTFARRLARDLVEARKPPHVLVSRGVRLIRDEPELLERWRRLGCRLADRGEALTSLQALKARPEVPPASLHPTVDHRQVLHQAVAQVDACLVTADLGAPVPACPGWTVLDLVEHLGGVHRWATVAIVEGRGDAEQPPAPRDRDALRSWFADGATRLTTTLDTADACQPCWTLAEPRTVAFWIRRQAHETAMHAWDLSAATTNTDDPRPPDLAADGVAEVVDMFWPRQIRLGRAAAPSDTVGLVASDTGHRWDVGPRGHPPAATVTAPAATLLLLVWRRIGLDDPTITVTGDHGVAKSFLALPLTP